MSNLNKHTDPEVQSEIDDMLLRIEAIRKEKKSPIVGTILDRFTAQARAFCPGIFHEQDPGNPAHRIADLIGGWPYTSELHPWPMTYGGDLAMQPIVQLRLSKVGQLFGVPAIGDGLLQVWGPGFTDFETVLQNLREPFLTRVIPAHELGTPPDQEPPVGVRWLDGQFRPKFEGVQFLMNPSEDCVFRLAPLVDWQPTRPMYGTFPHLFNVLTLDEQDQMGGSDDYWPIAEEIDEKLSSSSLSMHQHSVYLGGLGGAAGGAEDPSFDQDLLISLCDGDGFHFAITLEVKRNSQLEYKPVFKIRS
jgi:hypothetical protein